MFPSATLRRSFSTVTLLLFTVPSSTAATIPSDVKKAVTFIFRADASGQVLKDREGNPIPSGTGFFASVKNELNPALDNVYLITAAHVLRDRMGGWLPTVWLRLNKRQGDAEFVRLDLLVRGEKRIYTHPEDASVDVAVIPSLPDQSIFDFKVVQDDLLTTRESFRGLNIAEGSDIFFCGLFAHHYGQHKNYPIVRFGRVAMVTEEPILWKEPWDKRPQKLQLYLIETQSYGGNSGSPVFFYFGLDRIPGRLSLGGPVLKLAGIMKGSFNEPRLAVPAQNVPRLVSPHNVGIAAVVPSYFLHEILFSVELKNQRAGRSPTR